MNSPALVSEVEALTTALLRLVSVEGLHNIGTYYAKHLSKLLILNEKNHQFSW